MNDEKLSIYRDQYLMHYGVLGMRWGTRRRTIKTSKSKSKNKGISITRTSNKKRRMSNKELTSRVKRLKLEQEYAKLTEVPKPQTVSKVEKLVKAAGTFASLTGSAATIYKNLNDLGLVSKKKGV